MIEWEECLRVTIPGQPVAKGRPRFYMRGGRPKVHTDAKTRAFEKLVALCVSSSTATRGAPRPMCGVRDPVRVDIRAVFSRPVAMMRKKDPDEMVAHAKRPDL
jgi:Holliday junction resolvase RusA-like endonuclease